MNSKLFEGAKHSKNYAIYRPVPPNSLIKAIMSFLGKDQVSSFFPFKIWKRPAKIDVKYYLLGTNCCRCRMRVRTGIDAAWFQLGRVLRPFNSHLQSTMVLSPYFRSVTGLDVSKTQIEEARSQLHQTELTNTHYRFEKEPYSDCILALSELISLVLKPIFTRIYHPPTSILCILNKFIVKSRN